MNLMAQTLGYNQQIPLKILIGIHSILEKNYSRVTGPFFHLQNRILENKGCTETYTKKQIP
ncbi:hypothetical protein CHS0354_008842, partial [Potamilus streckersoni]